MLIVDFLQFLIKRAIIVLLITVLVVNGILFYLAPADRRGLLDTFASSLTMAATLSALLFIGYTFYNRVILGSYGFIDSLVASIIVFFILMTFISWSLFLEQAYEKWLSFSLIGFMLSIGMAILFSLIIELFRWMHK